jgi:hypothetical protein
LVMEVNDVGFGCHHIGRSWFNIPEPDKLGFTTTKMAIIIF